jgi:flagellar biosynthesis GTPase FlhF
MPTITVSAIDSATAMDQIIAQLGEDAMILDTKTKDGKLEIRATNDLAFQPKKSKQVSDVFSTIMREELNPLQSGDRARSVLNEANKGPVMDKAASDAFWQKLDGRGDAATPQANANGNANDDHTARETEANIRMRRLQWENEWLEKEASALKDLSREAVNTARQYFEQSTFHSEETKRTLESFREELASVRQTMVDKQERVTKTKSRRRLAMLMTLGVMALSAGAYGLRDQSEMIMPWVDKAMTVIGATINVSMDYIKVSDLEATRMGDTIKVKGMVINNYPLSADAPMIQFVVKDDQGVVLSERAVKIDQPALRPGEPIVISTQLVLSDRLDDQVVTNVTAQAVEEASLSQASLQNQSTI